MRQILHLDHMRYTVTFIQTKIDRLDAANKPPEDTVTESAGNIHLGSPKGVETVADFAKGLGDHGAAAFRGAFEESLNSFYKANDLPQEQYLRVRGSDQVMPKLLSLRMSPLFLFSRLQSFSIWKLTMRTKLTGNSALIASAAMHVSMVRRDVTMSLSIQMATTFLHTFFASLSSLWVNNHMPLHMLRHIAGLLVV